MARPAPTLPRGVAWGPLGSVASALLALACGGHTVDGNDGATSHAGAGASTAEGERATAGGEPAAAEGPDATAPTGPVPEPARGCCSNPGCEATYCGAPSDGCPSLTEAISLTVSGCLVPTPGTRKLYRGCGLIGLSVGGPYEARTQWFDMETGTPVGEQTEDDVGRGSCAGRVPAPDCDLRDCQLCADAPDPSMREICPGFLATDDAQIAADEPGGSCATALSLDELADPAWLGYGLCVSVERVACDTETCTPQPSCCEIEATATTPVIALECDLLTTIDPTSACLRAWVGGGVLCGRYDADTEGRPRLSVLRTCGR